MYPATAFMRCTIVDDTRATHFYSNPMANYLRLAADMAPIAPMGLSRRSLGMTLRMRRGENGISDRSGRLPSGRDILAAQVD